MTCSTQSARASPYPRSCGGYDEGARRGAGHQDATPETLLFGTRWTIRSRCERRTCRRASCSPANKFIVHRYKARSGHTSRAGILRVVAWMYLFKNYDLKDWVSFAEIYGLPLRLGKYAPGASDSDRRRFMRALIQIGSDAAGHHPGCFEHRLHYHGEDLQLRPL